MHIARYLVEIACCAVDLREIATLEMLLCFSAHSDATNKHRCTDDVILSGMIIFFTPKDTEACVLNSYFARFGVGINIQYCAFTC